MDSSQFKEFMKAQQELMKAQQEMLAQMVLREAAALPTVSGNNVNTSLVPNFETFDPAKEMYKNYIQRFKNYVEMKNLTSNEGYCAKLLLNSIGAANFNLIAALASPKAF